jgi:ABC-2 type transport system permease protein
MTLILFRKLLRDVRPALIVVCIVLFAFAAFWVKIAQRVTSEIAPVFNSVALMVGDLNFERPNDFLAMGMLHPIVLTLCVVWAIGRAAGAVAGEIDRGTMELLMSQPVPRNRLIVAHFLVDLVVLPCICFAFFAGTQFGLAVVGDFIPDYSSLKGLRGPAGRPIPIPIPDHPQPLAVNGTSELAGLANTFALMFAVGGITMALSAAGRSRWKVTGYAVLIVVVMFVANTIGQLWEPAAFVRPFTLFYYYQPQKAMLDNNWLVDLGAAWPGAPRISGIGVLVIVGFAGYLLALRTFTRRDLPAPL